MGVAEETSGSNIGIEQIKDNDIQSIKKRIESFGESNELKDDPKKDYVALASQYLVPQNAVIAPPETLFSVGEVPVFTKKSISTITAKAKAGKTTVAAWIIADLITKQIKVLWFDTEQGLYYSSRTQSWILRIACLSSCEGLRYYDLKVFDPTDRAGIIEALIKELRPDIVVIDGVRDLVFDINSPEEATNIVGLLMRLAEECNCHIVNILHLNKGNEQVRGHLGTELINKSESVLKVSTNDVKEIILEAEYTRNMEFAPIAFGRDEHGIPFLIEDWVNPNTGGGIAKVKGTQPYDIAPETHLGILKDVFKVEPSMMRSQLVIAAQANIKRHLIKKEFGVNKANEWIQHWEQFNLIVVSGTRGTRAARYSINENYKPN